MAKGQRRKYSFLEAVGKQINNMKHAALDEVRQNVEHAIAHNMLVAPYKIQYNPPGYGFIDEAIHALTGFAVHEYMEKGPALAIGHIVNNDVYMNSLMPDFFDFQAGIDDAELPEWYFATDFAFEKADKKIVYLHQRMVILERDENQMPLLSYGFITDASYLNSSPDQLMFTAVRMADGVVVDTYKKVFHAGSTQFSARETEILLLMRQGLSSKQIADRLYISNNTVNNHRAKMLAKVRAKNTAELLSYVAAQGLAD